MTHKKRFYLEDDAPKHNMFDNYFSSDFQTKVYIECNPPAHKVFGKVTGNNNELQDRKIREIKAIMNSKPKWSMDYQGRDCTQSLR
jgi:hypothetical protein